MAADECMFGRVLNIMLYALRKTMPAPLNEFRPEIFC